MITWSKKSFVCFKNYQIENCPGKTAENEDDDDDKQNFRLVVVVRIAGAGILDEDGGTVRQVAPDEIRSNAQRRGNITRLRLQMVLLLLLMLWLLKLYLRLL